MDIMELVHEDRSAATRPFACTHGGCHKAFARRSDLVRHMRIHSNERPWICNWTDCHRDFIQRSALTVHYRVHTGERPHACEYVGCDKAFSDSSSLARHRRIHTGKRPYKCPELSCAKTFCRKTTLTKHIKRTHPNSPSFSHGSFDSSRLEQNPITNPNSPTTPESSYDEYENAERVKYEDEGMYPLPELPELPSIPAGRATPEILSLESEPQFALPVTPPRRQRKNASTRNEPDSPWSAPASVSDHAELRYQFEQQELAESAYLTPPPLHPQHMRHNQQHYDYSHIPQSMPNAKYYYGSHSPRTQQRLYTPSPDLSQANEFSTPPYLMTPASSNDLHHAVSAHLYSQHQGHGESWSMPIPQHEFAAPLMSSCHSAQPIYSSPLNYPRTRRASSVGTLGYTLSETSTNGLGLTLAEPITLHCEEAGSAHFRRFSEIAGPGGGIGAIGAAAIECEDFHLQQSPTLSYRRPSQLPQSGYSTFMMNHLHQMDEIAAESAYE